MPTTRQARIDLATTLAFVVVDPYAVIDAFKELAPVAMDNFWRGILASWDATMGYNRHLSWPASEVALHHGRPCYAPSDRDRYSPWY